MDYMKQLDASGKREVEVNNSHRYNGAMAQLATLADVHALREDVVTQEQVI